MLFRIGLLLYINWIIGLKDTVLTIPAFKALTDKSIPLSYKDLILMAGGIFLIVKSTLEIHHKFRNDGKQELKKESKAIGFGSVIFQIVMVDAIFSFGSILTAIALVENIIIMIIAVIVSIGIMMLFAGPVTRVINAHPTLQMLALSFLVVIGVVLIASGLHQEISKSIIYCCLFFSLIVEMLNIKLRKRTEIV